MAQLSRAERKRREMLARRGLELTPVHNLHDALFAALSLESMGFRHFLSIESPRTRATASDLVISAVDAVETNLNEAALHAERYEHFVGPNGRTMPGPETSDADHRAWLDGEAELVACFRAMGSALDCLAGVAVGVLQLPEPIAQAHGGMLIQLSKYVDDGRLSSDQRDALSSVSEQLDTLRAEPMGWLEWELEMRNQLVHRGRQMTVWMQFPRRTGSPVLEPQTRMPPQYLQRFEPHLRRMPWLAEMEALGRQRHENMWLAEPATHTMRGLRENTVRLIEAASGVLAEVWSASDGERAAWCDPGRRWDVKVRNARRITEAAEFEGFDTGYPFPPPSSMRVSQRDAVRFQIAEALRRADEEGSR